MKNYVVFIGSFIVLLFVFQIASGLFLTPAYVPEPSQHLSSSTVSIFSFNYPFLNSIIAATFSFIISKKYVKLKRAPINK
ncbi:hypothetical protein ACLHDF_08405 [Priestia aryabhattai]|uniref:hypothetical protein n=1 Tax=Priestia megaterium TaxID=1404 RepID=UPI0039B9B3DB